MAKLAGNTAAAGNILSIGGTIGGLISGYYAAEAEKYKLRSNALNAEHQADMARINASIFKMQKCLSSFKINSMDRFLSWTKTIYWILILTSKLHRHSWQVRLLLRCIKPEATVHYGLFSSASK